MVETSAVQHSNQLKANQACVQQATSVSADTLTTVAAMLTRLTGLHFFGFHHQFIRPGLRQGTQQ